MTPFRRMADVTAAAVGSPAAFTAIVIVTGVWLALGPVFRFSDTWQLSMNTIASQVTFLIALLLQNTQDDAELNSLEREFQRIRERRLPPASDSNRLPRSSGQT